LTVGYRALEPGAPVSASALVTCLVSWRSPERRCRPGALVLSLTKGIEPVSGGRMGEVLAELLTNHEASSIARSAAPSEQPAAHMSAPERAIQLK
jgi:hypothetical protein